MPKSKTKKCKTRKSGTRKSLPPSLKRWKTRVMRYSEKHGISLKEAMKALKGKKY